MREPDRCAQKPLDLIRIGCRMLTANTLARDLAGKFVQIERDLQTLLARHFAVFGNLRVARVDRCHDVSLG